MSMTTVLMLDSEKIDILLKNHRYFSRLEIIMAAKVKVINDKKADFGMRVNLQRNNDLWDFNRHMNMANKAYSDGFNGSLQDSLLGVRFF